MPIFLYKKEPDEVGCESETHYSMGSLLLRGREDKNTQKQNNHYFKNRLWVERSSPASCDQKGGGKGIRGGGGGILLGRPSITQPESSCQRNGRQPPVQRRASVYSKVIATRQRKGTRRSYRKKKKKKMEKETVYRCMEMKTVSLTALKK